jgi:regulator-associated protein of mTOR
MADTGHRRRSSVQTRPTSARVDSSQDESEPDRRPRRPKPLLQRAKSDFGPRAERGEDPESQTEEEIQDWGARHGFEDHYESDYVSQLANVSC